MPVEQNMPDAPAKPADPGLGSADQPSESAVLQTRGLSIFFSGKQVVTNVSLEVFENRATALIGPSGCGKSTLLRQFNRLNELLPGVEIKGQVLFRGTDLCDPQLSPAEVRRRIGMVFQKPNPFPASIYENIAWGPRLNRTVPDKELPGLVEYSLRSANLWEDVRDRLADGAGSLSVGQQQRLCIARAIAMRPEVVLMDEPCSALDPAAAAAIEDLIIELKSRFTILIASHDVQQAERVADYVAVMEAGCLVQFSDTASVIERITGKQSRS